MRRENKKKTLTGIFLASLPSLTRLFYSRSRPFARRPRVSTDQRKKYDCFAVYANGSGVCVCSVLMDLLLLLLLDDTTWTCTVCTFANHEALEICEMCEMPRNRALEARAWQNLEQRTNFDRIKVWLTFVLIYRQYKRSREKRLEHKNLRQDSLLLKTVGLFYAYSNVVFLWCDAKRYKVSKLSDLFFPWERLFPTELSDLLLCHRKGWQGV